MIEKKYYCGTENLIHQCDERKEMIRTGYTPTVILAATRWCLELRSGQNFTLKSYVSIRFCPFCGRDLDHELKEYESKTN